MTTPKEIRLDEEEDDAVGIEGPEVLGRLHRWEERSEAIAREAVEARLDAWNARVQALRVQVHLAGMDARTDAGAPLTRIEAKLDQARDRIRELELQTRDVWTVLAETYDSVRAEIAAGEHLIGENTH